MQPLNFPSYHFRLKNHNKPLIFDQIRRKYVVLTPEEWVRQHVICFLLTDKQYPKQLVNVEKTLLVNGLRKRYDVVVYNSDGSIRLLVECKAPDVAISQFVFDQIARYNLTLQAELLLVTNGLSHYVCQINYQQQQYDFLPEVPKAGQFISLP